MSPRGKAWKDITSMYGEVLQWKESKTHGDVALWQNVGSTGKCPSAGIRHQCSIFSDFNNLCAESKLPAMIPYWHWAPLCLSCLFVFSVFLFTSKYFFVVCGQHQFCFICYITYSKLHSRSVYYMFLPIYSLPFYNKMLSSQFVATHKCPHYLNMNLILFKIRHCKDQDTALGLHFSKSCLSDLLIAISEIPQM